MDTSIVVTIIQVLGTISVAGFTWFTNHRIQKISEVKEELRTELKEQHIETLTKISDLEKIVDNNDIDVVRNRIVAFENLCRLDANNDTIKKYQYDTAYKDIDKWKEYHKKYPSLNGEIDIAIDNINEHYKSAKF